MRRMTHNMIRVLRFLANRNVSGLFVSGRSAYGGLTRTILALQRRKLIDKQEAVTAEGHKLLQELRSERDA